MFSGQGSQYYEMGKSLFALDTYFRKTMLELNDIYRECVGESLLSTMYNNKGILFNDILQTHPAIYMTEVALAKTLMNYGIEVKGVLGMSAGEFAALTIAEVLKPEDVLPIIISQAACISECCDESEMITVLENYKVFDEEPVLVEHAYMASINYDNNFVISCTKKSGKIVKEYLKEKNMTFMELPVKFGFHSTLIDQAKEKFLRTINWVKFRQPQYEYYSCIDGNCDMKSSYYFWDVARKPMNAINTFKQIKQDDVFMVDVGPSGTMANFAKYNNRLPNVIAALTQFGRHNEYESVQDIIKR